MAPKTSLQLFTVREGLEEDFDGTFAELAERGYTAVEPYDFVANADRIAAALEKHGMEAPSGHTFIVSESFINPDGSGTEVSVPTWDETFDAAEKLGMTMVIEPYTDPELWSDPKEIEHIANRLNAAAKVAAERGLRVGYHNHAHELEAKHGDQTGLELLESMLDPEVLLELDLYWVLRGGVDPVELVKKFGDRVKLVHAKDGSLDPELVAQYPPADQVVAGTGVVPLAEAIAAAPDLEVAIVEFDHFPGESLMDAVEQSRVYLDEVTA